MASDSNRQTPVRRVRRPSSSSGPPVLLIVLGIFALIGFLGFIFVDGVNKPNTASTMIFAAEKAFANGMGSIDVETKIHMAEADTNITAEERLQIKGLRERLKVRDVEIALVTKNLIGSTYLQKKLKNYSERYLSGSPEKPKARVFLKRCEYFKKRWPQHPELDWVQRQVTRFSGFVNLSEPPTFDDVIWEADTETRSKPRDYTRAFEAFDSFLKTASSEERTLITNIRKKMEVERQEYHEDRMKQAEFEFDKNKNEALAVQWLVWGVIGMGDQVMSDEAATYLLKMPNADAFFRGYRSKQPLVFERLGQYPLIKARLDALDE